MGPRGGVGGGDPSGVGRVEEAISRGWGSISMERGSQGGRGGGRCARASAGSVSGGFVLTFPVNVTSKPLLELLATYGQVRRIPAARELRNLARPSALVVLRSVHPDLQSEVGAEARFAVFT
eukprot:1800915-Pyramimonas_sp.AAC.1